MDRVLIDPVCVARNAVSDLDIAGGLGGGGCIEFLELEEEFISLAGSCSWFLQTTRRIESKLPDHPAVRIRILFRL